MINETLLEDLAQDNPELSTEELVELLQDREEIMEESWADFERGR